MNLQRFLSISISTLTIIPMYFLARRFFDKRYSLIGASLFVFEPRLIQNSLLGITEPLYIILTTTALFLFLSDRIKVIYLSFAFAAFCAMIRYEGIFLFILLSIVFFIRFRNEKRNLPKYVIALGIFVLLLLPMAYVRTQTMGYDGFTSHWTAGVTASIILSSQNNNNHANSILHFVGGGLENLVKYLGWTSLPFWLFFVPIGIYLILKERNYKNALLILSLVILIVPSLYAYSREIADTRYLYVLFPSYSVISLFTIRRIIEGTKNRNLFLILIVGAVLLSCAAFLDIKQYDINHQREAYNIDKVISQNANGVNDFYPEDSYLMPAQIPAKWPVLKSTLSFNIKIISTDGFSSLKDYIENSKSKGLTHLVIDDRQNRSTFLKDVFYNEEKYPYLIKIYDSKDFNYKYELKIYKIDYNKFDSHE
jgi:4-amino-4-deoxy-L-arabinose transferase-like glycosyltransferase